MNEYIPNIEIQYLDLLQNILDYGVKQTDRTGVGTRSIFDAKLVIPEGSFPLFTHRKINPRLAFEEMWFFLSGKTDTKLLEDKGVNFWKGNTSREFLDSRGLEFLPEGDLGTAYSQQWRNSNGWDGDGIDQLQNLIEGLTNDRYSRRHLVTLWNPYEEWGMPLTPCWWASQYVVLPEDGGDVLHVKLINRSLDAPYGCPFALMQYRMFQMALCKMFGWGLGKLSADLTHIHIYENQVEWVEELLERETSRDFNYLFLDKNITTLDELLSLEWEDWKVYYNNYNKEPWKAVKPPMAV